MIDWSKEDSKVSKYFSVRECIYLPRWDRLADEGDGLDDDMKITLIKSATVFDSVREFLRQPMRVHSFFRPKKYSPLVGGMDGDVHTQGLAVDFNCLPGLSSDQVKIRLVPALENLGIRMENNGKRSGWVHIDRHEVIHSRYFKA